MNSYPCISAQYAKYHQTDIMEYKSPEDGLNINTFYKVQGYACIYKAAETASAKVGEDDITTTIIREGKPAGLFKNLSGKGFEVNLFQAVVRYSISNI